MGRRIIVHLYLDRAKLSSLNNSLISIENRPVGSLLFLASNRRSILSMCWCNIILTLLNASRKFGRVIVPIVAGIACEDRSDAGLYDKGFDLSLMRGV